MEDDGALGGRVEDLMRALDRQAVRDSTEDDVSSHGDDDAGEERASDILDEIEEDCHRLVEQRGRYLREVFRIRSEANEVRSDLARMALRIDAYMYDHGEAERESDRYARGSPLHSRVSIL